MKMLGVMLAALPLALPSPAAAQMDHSKMPGMKTPAKPAAKLAPKPKAKASVKRAVKPKARPAKPAPTDPYAGHDMSGSMTMPKGAAPAAAGGPHAGHDMSAMPEMDMSGEGAAHGTGGTALPAGIAPAPAAPEPTYADRIWGRDAMVGSRDMLRREHGGGTFWQVMFNLAEVQVRDGRDGYRWDGEAWFGGDINRLVVKTEGSGNFGETIDDAEVQALYSRAIGPYFNLQAGVRYDLKPSPSRTYATVGFEGLAPYWFEVEGALFLSDKGDVLARAEGYHDQRITQRLILQPRLEANFAAQDVPANGIGSGLSDIELGLRLRYEIKREFAPYVGISYDRKIGDTARFARAAGDDVKATSLVVGVRTWF